MRHLLLVVCGLALLGCNTFREVEPSDVVSIDPCDSNQRFCEGICVDPLNNSEHCGACSQSCGEDESCISGTCQCPGSAGSQARSCTEDEACCPGLGCVETLTDERACGSCGTACNPGETCAEGVCVCGDTLGCAPGRVCCDGQCCGADTLCCEGQCLPAEDPTCDCGGQGSCNADETCCSDACVNTATDAQNCGACGSACGADQVCDGDCACSPGFADCDGDPSNGCEVAIDTDSHCGACNNDCTASGQTCTATGSGVYTCTCDGEPCTRFCCDGTCTDTDSDPQNCGSCGNVCQGNTCGSGQCDCEAGFGDCDGDASNGCEVETRNDPQHCGRCGNSCGDKASCSLGNCLCESGFGNCDRSFNNGCEINLNTNAKHCGACGNACGPNATCKSGACACNNGFGDCTNSAGCETQLDSNNAYCGACNIACQPWESCAGGACALATDWYFVTTYFATNVTNRVVTVRGDATINGNTWTLTDWEDSEGNSGGSGANDTGTLAITDAGAVTLTQGVVTSRGQINQDGNLLFAVNHNGANQNDVYTLTLWVRKSSGHTNADFQHTWRTFGIIGNPANAGAEPAAGWIQSFDGTATVGSNLSVSGQLQIMDNAPLNLAKHSQNPIVVQPNGAVAFWHSQNGFDTILRGHMTDDERVIVLTRENTDGSLGSGTMLMIKTSTGGQTQHLEGTYTFGHLFYAQPGAGTPLIVHGTLDLDGSGAITGGRSEQLNTGSIGTINGNTYSVDTDGSFLFVVQESTGNPIPITGHVERLANLPQRQVAGGFSAQTSSTASVPSAGSLILFVRQKD